MAAPNSALCALRPYPASDLTPLMLDATKPHNWIVLAVMILVLGFALRQISARVPAAKTVTSAAGFGA